MLKRSPQSSVERYVAFQLGLYLKNYKRQVHVSIEVKAGIVFISAGLFFFWHFSGVLELPVGTAEHGHLGLRQPGVSGGSGSKVPDCQFRPPQAKGAVTPRASLSNFAPASSWLRELSVTGNQTFHFPVRYSLKDDFFRVCGRLYQWLLAGWFLFFSWQGSGWPGWGGMEKRTGKEAVSYSGKAGFGFRTHHLVAGCSR